jgi:hypothetical protein
MAFVYAMLGAITFTVVQHLLPEWESWKILLLMGMTWMVLDVGKWLVSHLRR